MDNQILLSSSLLSAILLILLGLLLLVGYNIMQIRMLIDNKGQKEDTAVASEVGSSVLKPPKFISHSKPTKMNKNIKAVNFETLSSTGDTTTTSIESQIPNASRINEMSADEAANQKTSQQNDSPDYGYVFLVLGNLKDICCDAWLGPSGGSLDVRRHCKFPKGGQELEIVNAPKNFQGPTETMGKLFTYHPWPVGQPKPFTVHLSKNRGQTDSYIFEIERYIRFAAADAHRQNKATKARKGVCPLLATPLLGTGMGGNFRKTGEMVKRLLPILYRLADELKVDIALVTIEEEVFTLMHSLRHQLQLEQSADSPILSSMNGERYLRLDLRSKLKQLAYYAVKGELTLFLGAGVSMGSGLPSWTELLERIARTVGLDEKYMEEFQYLDPYSKAAILEQRLQRYHSVQEKRALMKSKRERANSNSDPIDINNVHEALTSLWKQAFVNNDTNINANDDNVESNTSQKVDNTQHSKLPNTLGECIALELTRSGSIVSLAHALLASLPVKEIITTNYDNLIERAWLLSGRFSVLPYMPIRGCDRWLLKLHGSVDRPEEIVFTKKDYIRFHDRFAALAGIVQSTLLTRHLLCVGFSLDDDNFQRIFDSVRKARSPFRDINTKGDGREKSMSTLGLPMKSGVKKGFNAINTDYLDWKEWTKGNFCSNSDDDKDDEECSTNARMIGPNATAVMLQFSHLKRMQWEDDIEIIFFENDPFLEEGSSTVSPPGNSSTPAILAYPEKEEKKIQIENGENNQAIDDGASSTMITPLDSSSKNTALSVDRDSSFKSESAVLVTEHVSATTADNMEKKSESHDLHKNNDESVVSEDNTTSETIRENNSTKSGDSNAKDDTVQSDSVTDDKSKKTHKRKTDFWALARTQEIMLDQLSGECARSGTAKFLMKERYADALSTGEQEMKALMQKLFSDLINASPSAKESKAYKHVRKCLHGLGK